MKKEPDPRVVITPLAEGEVIEQPREVSPGVMEGRIVIDVEKLREYVKAKGTAPLEHTQTMYGCRIDHDLENTVAVLRDPDGGEQNFTGNETEPNATLQAIHWAKDDQKKRGAAKLEARRDANEQRVAPPMERPIERDESDTESEGE